MLNKILIFTSLFLLGGTTAFAFDSGFDHTNSTGFDNTNSTGFSNIVKSDIQNMKVVIIDLKTKGESILVIYPNGETMLVDGGMQDSYTELKHVLKKHNVKDINTMVATHADQDRVGGLIMVLNDRDFKVHNVLISSVTSDTDLYRNFINAIHKNGIKEQIGFDGHVINIDTLVSTEIISPSPSGLSSANDATLVDSNSLVTLLTYNNISFLFTSDASFLTEEYIINNHPVDIDIMTSPHHGLKYSSTDAFLDMVTPQLTIISADKDNQYGHPHSATTTRYESYGIPYYQTGKVGTITIETDGVRCSLILNDEVQPCYDWVLPATEYITPILPLCKTHNPNFNNECAGWLHIVKNGYYNYGTGFVYNIIDPYGDGRDIWIVPGWALNIQEWYDEGLTTQDDLNYALQYLIDKKIAVYARVE